jgi:hypothetical protein
MLACTGIILFIAYGRSRALEQSARVYDCIRLRDGYNLPVKTCDFPLALGAGGMLTTKRRAPQMGHI